MTELALRRVGLRIRKPRPPYSVWVLLTLVCVWTVTDAVLRCVDTVTFGDWLKVLGAGMYCGGSWPQLRSPYDPVMINLPLALAGCALGFVGGVWG